MKTITICGSMMFYDQMVFMAKNLTEAGFKVHTPTQEEVLFHNMSDLQKTQAKKRYIQEQVVH